METSKDTFRRADTNTKLDLLFDCIHAIDSKIDEKLDRYKKRTFLLASGGGVIGGFLAALSKWAIF